MTPKALRRNAEKWDLFECYQCGKCCTELGLPYYRDSIPAIAQFLGISMVDVMHTYYGKPAGDDEHWELEDSKMMPCPFLIVDANRKACRIYPVRPDGCRAFPFDTDFGTCGVACPAAEKVYVKLELPRHKRNNGFAAPSSAISAVSEPEG